MYCTGCGTAINAKLNYCKNCGARIVKGEDAESPGSLLENLLTPLIFIVLGGFGILIGLMAILLKSGITSEAIIMIAIFYLAVLGGISYMILSQLPKIINAKLNSKNDSPELYQVPQISPKTTAQLEEYREPTISVVEDTTRNFEKVPRH